MEDILTQQNSTLNANLDQYSELQSHDQYTTFNQLTQIQIDDDDNQEIFLEQGQMDTTKLSIFNPLYKQIIPSRSDTFYMKFFNCLEGLNGQEKARYDVMKERFKKFFIQKDGIERGQRWNKRIEPDYSSSQTYPLCYAIMIYGVDYLSNRDIKKALNLPKQFKNIKRINWSNAAIIFDSKDQLDKKIKPHLFDNQKLPFFEPKEEQDLPNFMPTKLPRGWYGLRPYEHKDEYIFWFVRYLTSLEPELLNNIQQKTEFMQTYNASKRMWQKKQKQRLDFDTSLNTSRFQTIYRSQKQRSVHMGSEPEMRQRSREKVRKQVESENYARSDILSQLDSNFNHKPHSDHPDLNESYLEQMSFIYNPAQNTQIDAEFKKKSDEIIQLMQCLHVGPVGNTLESVKNADILDLDDDMAIISDTYDPKGLNDCFFFDRKNKISKLTELKPDQKFNYTEYCEKILEAEEQNREKRAIPVIFID